jgi:hypothetical protein
MNVFVVIGGRTDWSNEGGSDFTTEVVGVYCDRAKAELMSERYLIDNRTALADETEVELDDINDDEFWSEIVVKQLDDV